MTDLPRDSGRYYSTVPTQSPVYIGGKMYSGIQKTKIWKIYFFTFQAITFENLCHCLIFSF